MKSTAIRPVAGAAKGFESLEPEEERIGALPVRGELPSWLSGSLLRTGPAKWEIGEQRMAHWFDGLAMLHRFSFEDGAVSYASRFLESRAYGAAREQGRIAFPEFATDPCRSLFRRVQSLFSPGELSDNANVNVGRLGERFIAMTETPLPVEFDPGTLAAAGAPYRAPGQLTTAHPHRERVGGAMLNYAARLGRRSAYCFFRVAPEAGGPEVIASIPVKEPAYMHSFGVTERFLVLAEFPLVVNPARLALAGRPYIENYRWKPDLGTRFSLVDRESGALTTGFRADPCFAFHHVNAYDGDGEVVVDLCAYPDAQVVQDLYLDRLRAGKPVSQAALTRFRLSLSDRTVTRERLADQGLELPSINYERCNERPYRYAWGTDTGPGGWIERIAKVDTGTGHRDTWMQDGCFPGEPVFVAAPGAVDEDAGVLLSVVLDGQEGNSFMLVLDAHSLDELARAEVPHHIPFGFHGMFTESAS